MKNIILNSNTSHQGEPEPYKRKFSEEEYQDWFIEFIPLTGFYFAKNKDDEYIGNWGGDIVNFVDKISLYKDLYDNYNKDTFAIKSKSKDDALKVIDGYLLYQKLSEPEIIKV
jgi:hypothetical protein